MNFFVKSTGKWQKPQERDQQANYTESKLSVCIMKSTLLAVKSWRQDEVVISLPRERPERQGPPGVRLSPGVPASRC